MTHDLRSVVSQVTIAILTAARVDTEPGLLALAVVLTNSKTPIENIVTGVQISPCLCPLRLLDNSPAVCNKEILSAVNRKSGLVDGQRSSLRSRAFVSPILAYVSLARVI